MSTQADQTARDASAPEPPEPIESAPKRRTKRGAPAPAAPEPVEAESGASTPTEDDASRSNAARAEAERRRLEEQLAMLERKQAEVRRALAIADHPAVGEAIREIEGRIYRASKVEQRLAHPLSKSEARQREKLEKKLEVARAKRSELDATIAALESELQALGDGRLEGLRAEHDAAVRALFTTLAQHADAFEAAGLQVTNLMPELTPWLPALRALADGHVAEGEP